jgi:hypothetical protein
MIKIYNFLFLVFPLFDVLIKPVRNNGRGVYVGTPRVSHMHHNIKKSFGSTKNIDLITGPIVKIMDHRVDLHRSLTGIDEAIVHAVNHLFSWNKAILVNDPVT